MKRKIALLLALVMVLSMVPMMAFAASGNTETIIKGGVPRIADDYDSEVARGEFKNLNSLVIKKDNYNVDASSFQLRIENAKWSKNAYTVGGDVYGITNKTDNEYEITSRTDRVLDIDLLKDIDGSYEFEMPLYYKADGTGSVKVTIDPMDSGITGGTFTVANAAKGATVLTIDDVTTFSEIGELDPIRIEETAMGSLEGRSQTIRFRLPSNFEWVRSVTNSDIEGIGGLKGKVTNVSVNAHDGERDLEITLDVAKSTTRGSILIKNAKIFATDNAKEGEVEVRVSGGEVTTESLVVAKYSDFDVTVKADGDAKELISGRFAASSKEGKFDSAKESDLEDEIHELQKLVIKEDVKDALLKNRRTKVEFPSWVKILGVEVDAKDAEVTIHGRGVGSKIDDTKRFELFDEDNRGESELELNIDPANNKEAEVKLKFFVSVKADAEGDIAAKVSGRSGAEGEVVLGTTRRAVELEIKGSTPKLELGKKSQPIADIIVSEIEDEDLMEGNLVLNLSNDATWGSYKVEVTDGDLEVDYDNIDDNSNGDLIIPIKKSGISTKASTIKVSNASVDMKRMAADGDVNVRVRGSAVRKNHVKDFDANKLDAGYFDQSNVVVAKVAELLHGNYREPGLVTQEVVLTIGSKTMFVDGVEETANAAPYIDSANRTMLPVSAIGRALGATVEWNDAARTVLVTKDNTRALLTIGKDVMNVNGMEIPMRSKAVISGERTFVPLKDLGVALGVNVEWDAATRTVTIK